MNYTPNKPTACFCYPVSDLPAPVYSLAHFEPGERATVQLLRCLFVLQLVLLHFVRA